jgi:hypothetical protein
MDVIHRIKERQDALRREIRHVLTGFVNWTDIDGGIFGNDCDVLLGNTPRD